MRLGSSLYRKGSRASNRGITSPGPGVRCAAAATPAPARALQRGSAGRSAQDCAGDPYGLYHPAPSFPPTDHSAVRGHRSNPEPSPRGVFPGDRAMKKSPLLLALLPFAAACIDLATAPDRVGELQAPTAAAQRQLIPGRYVVVLRPGNSGASTASDVERQFGTRARHVYQRALSGFAMDLTDEQLARLRSDARVAYIEADWMAYPIGSGSQPNPPSWGLDRTDQNNLPLNNVYG